MGEKKQLPNKQFDDNCDSENEDNQDIGRVAQDSVFQLRGKEKQSLSAVFTCRECSTEFDSRNKLMEHLKQTGHAVATHEEIAAKQANLKKKKKNKIGF